MGHHYRNNNNNQPFDLNALGNMDLGALFQLLGSMDTNQLMAMISQIPIDPNNPNATLRADDPRLGIFYSLRAFLPPENAHIIDEVIKTVTTPKNK
jgi:hypothetical protein